MSIRTVILSIVSGLCLLSWGISIINRDAASEPVESTHPISRQIQYSFTLQNKTNRLLKEAEFWTYAPVRQTSVQRCVRLEASHPYQLILDDLGNQILHFTLNNLPPYATKIITIKADLALSDTPNMIPIQDLQPFLRAEDYIESDDPGLSQFAKRFKAPNPTKIAEDIFHWVADNVQYAGYLKNDRGALYALRNKKGDCTEFMYLFVALCRVNHIPARGIGGYVYSENNILKPDAYHNWEKFYDDGVWKIADPQKKVFMQIQSNYIAMRLIGESPRNPMGKLHRFQFTGNGLKVKMNQ